MDQSATQFDAPRQPRPAIPGEAPWHTAWRRFRENRLALISAIVVLVVIVASIFGPFSLGFNYYQADFDLGLSPPSFNNGHYLGTDILGRDLLARILYGGRLSLLVALVGTTISLLIGVSFGAVSGYCGGKVDEAMMRVVDVLYSLPYMFLVIVLLALFADARVVGPLIEFFKLDPNGAAAEWLSGPGVRMVLLFAAIGAVSWLTIARIVRGQVLSLKNEQFVEAARAVGASSLSIIFKHLVPNTTGVIIVYATLTIPSVILQEAFLSFLGLGIQAPQASWGTLINDGVQAMGVAPWLLVFPCGIMVLTLFCLNVIGDGLRDAFDARE
jgi:oligopeptide transport system permease protein